ncbi:hypothetical protein J6590_072420 [Homalodisca vitripennis]|nr:hypothetical protein J6590_072420 [Homalodisca vitripennis]
MTMITEDIINRIHGCVCMCLTSRPSPIVLTSALKLEFNVGIREHRLGIIQGRPVIIYDSNWKRIHNTVQLDKSADNPTCVILGGALNWPLFEEESQGFIQKSKNLGLLYCITTVCMAKRLAREKLCTDIDSLQGCAKLQKLSEKNPISPLGGLRDDQDTFSSSTQALCQYKESGTYNSSGWADWQMFTAWLEGADLAYTSFYGMLLMALNTTYSYKLTRRKQKHKHTHTDQANPTQKLKC